VGEQIDDQHPRVISSTNRRERINVPEVVYEKGGLRGVETICQFRIDRAKGSLSSVAANSAK
jgi:hypothetical protein